MIVALRNRVRGLGTLFMRAAFSILAVGAVISLLGVRTSASADDDAPAKSNPRDAIAAVDRSLAQAGADFRAKRLTEAATALDEAKASLKTLDDADIPADLRPQVDRLQERVAAADRLIAKARTPAAKPPPAAAKVADASKKKPDAPLPAAQAAKAKKPPKSKKPVKAPAGPSFISDVAPIFNAKCGNCHVRNARGGFSMASFAALEKGTKDGPVIRPGASRGSRLVEVLLSGDMPRGGGKIAPEELLTIGAWIDAGAQFDGIDRAAPLGQKSGGAGMPAGLVRSTGKESVQFNRDLAPVLAAQCLGCHAGDQPSGQLRMETFTGLLAGGATGKVIAADQPTGESLLLKRLRGVDGDRMPLEKPALPAETIAQFETWIKEGAKFDGADPAQPLKISVEEQLAGRLSHDELTAKRLTQAARIWQLAVPDEKPEQLQTANFILFGNVSTARLNEVGQLAEAERTKMIKLLRLDAGAPLVKGSLVVYVLKRSFDYSEFVRMVEERETPRGITGHVRAKGSDLYACLAAPSDADATLPALVAEQVAGGFLQGLGDVPAWFVVGGGRAIAARLEPKNPLTKQWEAELRELPVLAGADVFMSAAVFDPQTAARSFAFVKALSTNLGKLQSLIAALGAGRDFAQSMEDVYRTNTRALVERWLQKKP